MVTAVDGSSRPAFNPSAAITNPTLSDKTNVLGWGVPGVTIHLRKEGISIAGKSKLQNSASGKQGADWRERFSIGFFFFFFFFFPPRTQCITGMFLGEFPYHINRINKVRPWMCQWLRCCATNRKVAGSIPASVIGFFIDIKSFRSHYGPGVDSASNRNEYQKHFLGVKAAGAYGWQPYHHPVPLSCNLGTLTSWNPLGHSRPVMGLLLPWMFSAC